VGAKRTEDPPLEQLRTRLSSIDRSLIVLLCAREGAQREILALKQARSLPLLDRGRERDALRRVRAWALEMGGDPKLAVTVVRAALESGKRRFRRAGRSPQVGRHAFLALFPGPPGTRRHRRRRAASKAGRRTGPGR